MTVFWQDQRILIGICGGIAAYKVCMLVSSLAKQGANVRVILTPQAETFVTALTFATLSRQPAYTDRDFWNPAFGRPLHIDLAEWASVIVIAPLTAHTLAKLVHGLADTLLTNVILASTCPILVAPAMNTQMWQAPPVQANWQALTQLSRYWAVNPEHGRLACDTLGQGRMAEPEILEQALLALIWTQGWRDWQGKRVLISGGGTREPLDPVRFIGNPASGRMGLALATAAIFRGAQVTLVQGPGSNLEITELGIQILFVQTAAQMHETLLSHFPEADLLIMAAAVGDVRPVNSQATKIPKLEIPLMLPLETIPDILQDLSRRKQPHQRLVGFAAQSGDIVSPAKAKLVEKDVDAIVANPIDQPDSGFASSWNQATIVSRTADPATLPHSSKVEMAHRILDFIRLRIL